MRCGEIYFPTAKVSSSLRVSLNFASLHERAIKSATQHRTTMIIAHRLSTVRRADTVIVLEGGSVVESGPPSQLLAHLCQIFCRFPDIAPRSRWKPAWLLGGGDQIEM